MEEQSQLHAGWLIPGPPEFPKALSPGESGFIVEPGDSQEEGLCMAVGSPQVRLRGLASSRFEKLPRFRESLVTMPAARKKMSSWNQAGLTGSRIIMAGGGLARPPGGPGGLPGPPAARNHLPRWLRLDDLSKISLQPYGHPHARHERSGFPLAPLMHPTYSPSFGPVIFRGLAQQK